MTGDGQTVKGEHFDMAEIKKAEKAKTKKGKKGKKTKQGQEETKTDTLQDFEMDVKDPRFASVFESHEYAIDPSNPKFSGTEGMKQLLEEGRRKRRARDDDGDDAAAEVVTASWLGGGGKKQKTNEKEVDELMKRVKKRRV